jgi:hypothetical protein
MIGGRNRYARACFTYNALCLFETWTTAATNAVARDAALLSKRKQNIARAKTQ